LQRLEKEEGEDRPQRGWISARAENIVNPGRKRGEENKGVKKAGGGPSERQRMKAHVTYHWTFAGEKFVIVVEQ